MTAFNFPDNPNTNDTYTATNGRIYIYDGEKWNVQSQQLIFNAAIDSAGDLQITFTDGSSVNAGNTIGPTGATGPQGIQGIQGDSGEQGIQGIQGEAATITLGTVTTGTAGTSVSITNSGDSNDAVFNFTIPRGDQGFKGGQVNYIYDTQTGNADPGASKFRFSAGYPYTSTSAIYIDQFAVQGDATEWINWLDDNADTAIRGYLVIARASSTAQPGQLVFAVTGSVTDNSGWYTIPVDHVSGTTIYSNNTEMIINFFPAGEKGAKGDSGDAGAIGPGIAVGGTTGQYLIKATDSDYNTTWTTLPNILDSANVSSIIESYGYLTTAIDSAGVATIVTSYGYSTYDSSNAANQIESYNYLTDAIDSARIVNLIDSAYVQLRQTPQDFAYSSLTGTPTNVSSFTNDAGYLTTAIDSAGVAIIVTSYGYTTYDSADTIGLVDSAYVQLRQDYSYNSLTNVPTDIVTLSGTQTLTNKTITDAVFDNSFTIGSQIFYEQGTNGFSVNEDFDPSNDSTQTAYHFTSGSGRTELAFTLARTASFTNGFGIYGNASNNTFVSFGEQGNTNWEWRTGVGIRPLDLDGGTLRMSLSNAGDLTITGNFLGTPGPYDSDGAAAANGVTVGGQYYRNSGQVYVRLT